MSSALFVLFESKFFIGLVSSHLTSIYSIASLLVTGVVPLLSSAANGGRNKSTYKMTNYLHQINVKTPTNAADGSVDCVIYKSGVNAWVEAQSFDSRHTSLENDKRRIVWGRLKPARCGLSETFIPNEECKSKPDSPACDNWSNATISDIEELLGIRSGSLIAVEENAENGISTKAIYNLSDSVVRTAFNSFMLQLTMLILVIASLGYLRHDASRYVIAPLRKMLKIVLRYAENPLAGAPSNDDSTPVSELRIDDLNSDGVDIVDGKGKNSKLGSYETEQLITAVTKITNLLRKCWGVAGAGIISSNLARNKDGKNTVVFNPTVPGKIVYAIFGFAGINDFSHLLRSLDKDVMTLINDVAQVVHNEGESSILYLSLQLLCAPSRSQILETKSIDGVLVKVVSVIRISGQLFCLFIGLGTPRKFERRRNVQPMYSLRIRTRVIIPPRAKSPIKRLTKSSIIFSLHLFLVFPHLRTELYWGF